MIFNVKLRLFGCKHKVNLIVNQVGSGSMTLGYTFYCPPAELASLT